jgi:hypothetical protein
MLGSNFRTLAILTEVFHGILGPLQTNAGIIPRLAHDSFHPYTFTIHQSSYHLVLTALLNNPQKKGGQKELNTEFYPG